MALNGSHQCNGDKEMLNEDQLKIARRALDYLMANADLTKDEMVAAKHAYVKLDPFIDGDSIASVWSVEDVYSLITDEDGEPVENAITVEEARQVLKLVDRTHDATIGINWDVLEVGLETVRREHA